MRKLCTKISSVSGSDRTFDQFKVAIRKAITGKKRAPNKKMVDESDKENAESELAEE